MVFALMKVGEIKILGGLGRVGYENNRVSLIITKVGVTVTPILGYSEDKGTKGGVIQG